MPKITECMIAWDHGTANIEVGPWPDVPGGWSDKFGSTGGGCYASVQAMTAAERTEYVLAEFAALVTDGGIPVEVAHREFLKIDEYRDAVSPNRRMARTEPEIF